MIHPHEEDAPAWSGAGDPSCAGDVHEGTECGVDTVPEPPDEVGPGSRESGDLDDDLFATTDTTSHDPFPSVVDPSQHHDQLPGQVHVESGNGSASGLAMEVDGVMYAVVPKHDLGDTGVHGTVETWLPGHRDDIAHDAEVVFIHCDHDMCVVRLDPAISEAIRQNFAVKPVFHLDAQAGLEAGFTQYAGVGFPVLRHGVIAGDADQSGDLRTLTTEGTPGSSGAFVSDRDGHIVGQVVAYDPENHVNIMSSAEQILGDLQDFRSGVNMELKASPVSYGGSACPVVRCSANF